MPSTNTPLAEIAPAIPAGPLPHSILIIEDEDNVADGICQLLETAGMQCAIVHRGLLAIGQIETREPEVILLDIGLPDISGVELFPQIRGRWPAIPVIFMSGHFSRADLEEFLALPHVGFLQKPFKIEQLIELLQQQGNRGD